MALVAAAITCDAIGSNLEVVRVSGSEGMNRLSSWSVDILLQEPIDLEDCLRKDAVLALIDNRGRSPEFVNARETAVTFNL